MKKQTKKALKKKVDELWAEVIKIKANHKCEYCGKESYLNSHHIFSRSNHSTRWDIDNGVCLCVGHHVFSSKFSAHKAPAEFIEWIKDYRGEEWYNRLRVKAKTPSKFNLEDEKKQLNDHKKKFMSSENN